MSTIRLFIIAVLIVNGFYAVVDARDVRTLVISLTLAFAVLEIGHLYRIADDKDLEIAALKKVLMFKAAATTYPQPSQQEKR